MAFGVTKLKQTGNGGGKQIDWNAMNAHVIEQAKTQAKARSLAGVISGVIDLGVQKRQDAEEEFKGNAAEEAKIVAEKPFTYFVTKGDGKRYKCYPLGDCQQVAITVDFPQILVDKGQFFGTSNPQPLRMVLNGEISLAFLTNREEDKAIKVVRKGYPLSVKKYADKVYGFDPKNTLWKLADAVGLVGDDKVFHPSRLDELVGKAAQFQVRIYSKDVKGKSYYTEEIKLQGLIPEGVPVPELDASLQYVIQCDAENTEQALKQLRRSLINTIQRATDYEGKAIQKQLEALSLASKPSAPTEGSEKAPESAAELPMKPEDDDVVGDDDPF